MDINDVQLVGGPCGQHGPYTFYKAFKYTKNGIKKIITLSEFFFVKMWRDSDLLCISELQLLWTDKNSEQTLASLRLYFLPENTPEGRLDQGEDEVLAISEKVVIRLDDLISWITVETEWNWGRLAKCEEDLKDVSVETDQLACPRKPAGNSFTLSENIMDFSDVELEREKYETAARSEPHVIILSFPKYCRYRAMMKRLEGVENLFLKYKIVNALGGFYVKHPNTRVLFCRDTFDYPELEGHELLCNHLAPKLKGRPRGKRKKRSVSPGSESNESESSVSNQFGKANERSNGVCPTIATRRSTRCHENNENKQFMKMLTEFMKSKQLPMGRVPSLGYKELNLFEFYTRVQKLGGYECVTTNRLWKSIFDDMTGHLSSTSAATIIRRHYERFLLSYERHEKGEEDKPLPILERRRLKSKQNQTIDSGTSDSDSGADSPGTSRSSTSPVVENSDNKESTAPGKTSSLRSIRVKSERQKERTVEKPELPSASPPEPVKESKQEEETIKEETLDIKVEVKVETNVTVEVKVEEAPEIKPIKEEPRTEEAKNGSSAPAEPNTNAATPVVTTVVPEKNMSPREGKENIPLMKRQDSETFSVVPKVSSSPEPSKFKPQDEPIRDVKKIKLEILKEGGLEVTAVKGGASATSIKDFRPSVIQSTLNKFSKPIMAPPSLLSNVLPKRNSATVSVSVNITEMKSPSTPVKTANHHYLNGATPPKVVQSKSIYSYSDSQKTVYGNPKDGWQPTMIPHAPKTLVPQVRYGGSDPMDLSLTSPQKPSIEVSAAPQNFSLGAQTAYNRPSVAKNLYKTTTPPSVIDGRKLGPNLEITLVNAKQTPSMPMPRHPISHKRPTSETYAQKIAKLKLEEFSGRHSKYHIPPMHKPDYRPVPNQIKSGRHPKSLVPPPQMPPQQIQLPPPQYMHSNRFVPSDPHNGMPPPFMHPSNPMMESFYYQAAMQNAFASIPPLPMPTPEQLKFYAELMARSRGPNIPYGHPADGHPSMKKQ